MSANLKQDIMDASFKEKLEMLSKYDWQNAKISPVIEVKQEPRIDDKGIWMPVHEYVPENMVSAYRLVISKEMFVEAYNKWIKGE